VYYVFVEHRLVSLRSCDQPGLRIAHWNSTSILSAQLPQAAGVLAELDADLVVLTNPSRIHRLDATRALVADGGIILRPQPFAVISRLPVLEVRSAVSSQQMHVVVLRVDAGETLGRELTLWLVDLPSDPEQSRMKTARQVRAWIDRSNLPPADIIVGDFNMTRGSAALKTIAPDHRHAFDVAGVGYGATYPRQQAWLHIDHMLIADDIDAASYCIRDPGLGTHRLQIVTIKAEN
jgi:hypothetical protein